MTDPQAATVAAELEAVARAEAELAALTRRLDAGRQALAREEQALAATRLRLTREQADVADLEGLSVARIRAVFRGAHHSDLERERAEQQAAEYAVALAAARCDQARDEVSQTRLRVRALDGLAARRQAALDAKEAWLRTTRSEVGDDLDDLARELGAAQEQQRQLAEAGVAAALALDRLRAAADQLGSASSWSTYDTLFGGGMISTAIKHDRMDEATALIRQAGGALERLRTELADVAVDAPEGVELDGLTRAFDLWFDNIFTDIAVHDRIRGAAARVDAATQDVRRAARLVEDRERATRVELTRLSRAREELLLRG